MRRRYPQALEHLGCRKDPAIRQQHGKFLTPVAGQDVGRPQRAAPSMSGLVEQGVSRRMPVPVVEALELVEVDDRQDQRPATGLRTGKRCGEGFVPRSPVRQAGQGVGPGQNTLFAQLITSLLLELLAVGDVVGNGVLAPTIRTS